MTHRETDRFPVIGILGGGQLGRMTALAAIRMGLQVRFLVPSPAGPVEGVGTTTGADWTDHEVLRAFAEGCDVVTVESEWAPADILAEVLPSGTALWPSPRTIEIIRHKGLQKETLLEHGLPVPDFECCTSLDAALAAAERFGYPILLKRYRGSYDGYGNATVNSSEELRRAWPDLADEEGLMVEAWVHLYGRCRSSSRDVPMGITSSTPLPSPSNATTGAMPSSYPPGLTPTWLKEPDR